MSDFSHLDSSGAARMVDVSQKAVQMRTAIAEGFITLQRKTLEAILDAKVPKGDILAAARIAGILAAKKCGDLIPLCHPLPLERVEVGFDFPDLTGIGEAFGLRVHATAAITAKTGVEMEALTAVTIAALTLYDMCKAIDKTMVIHGVRLVSKTKS